MVDSLSAGFAGMQVRFVVLFTFLYIFILTRQIIHYSEKSSLNTKTKKNYFFPKKNFNKILPT